MRLLFRYPFLFILAILPSILPAQWQRQFPLEILQYVRDIVVKPDGYGYAVGNENMIIRLTPESSKWELMPPAEQDLEMYCVDYLDGSKGKTLVVGGDDGIHTSFDGGFSWKKLNPAVSGVFEIKMISENEIVAVGRWGAYKWQNNQFTNLNIPSDVYGPSGFILDEDHIWDASPLDSTIIYTSNGGQAWSLNTTVIYPERIRFFDTQFGVVFDRQKLYHSYNGGKDWKLFSNNGIHERVNEFTFGSSANVVIAATQDGATISLDSGRTWAIQDLGNLNQSSGSVESISDSEFWIGNSFSAISHTTDGGKNWHESTGPLRRPFYDIHFFNPQFGIAVGGGGAIFRTFDGGWNWEEISFEKDISYYTIEAPESKNLWIGGDNYIYQSIDSANSWIIKGVFPGDQIRDMHVEDDSIIIACSNEGQIYRSENGGESWETTYQSANSLLALTRMADSRYLAVGEKGLILRSADLGKTWAVLDSSDGWWSRTLTDCYSLGQDTWVLANEMNIPSLLHSTNGGDAWDTIDMPHYLWGLKLLFTSRDTGIVIGNTGPGGKAYLTYDGGNTWSYSAFPVDLYCVNGLPGFSQGIWVAGDGLDIEFLNTCDLFPEISNLEGNQSPCVGEVMTYSIESTNADKFYWDFPEDWEVVEDSNTSTIEMRAGFTQTLVSVYAINSCGKSAILKLDVTPVRLPEEIFVEGDVLYVPEDGHDYQWYLNGEAISGATGSLYVISSSGIYQVEITSETGCTKFTLPVNAIYTGISIPVQNLKISVVPSPANKNIFINGIKTGDEYRIYNCLGHMVDNDLYSNQTISIEGLSPGLYTLLVLRSGMFGISRFVVFR